MCAPALVEEIAILIPEVRFGCLFVERKTESWLVPDIDEAIFDDRVRQTFDDVIPPIRPAQGIFKSDIVLRHGRPHMDLCGDSEQSVEDSMRGNQDAVKIGVFGDPLHFRDSAHIFRVGADHVDGLRFDEILEVFPQVDLLSGVDRG